MLSAKPGDKPKAHDGDRRKGFQQSFCVPFELLEPVAIKELQKKHPGAILISTDWILSGGSGHAVLWWVPGPQGDNE